MTTTAPALSIPAAGLRSGATQSIPATHATPASGRVGGRHRCSRARALHLVDLENLLAGRVDGPSVTATWHQYQQVTGMRWDDHVVVAVAKKHAAATFLALPTAIQRVIGRNTPDGADLALIDAIDLDWAARRFGQVMVATGDGIFTDTARRLRARGLQVVQVIGGGLPATRLYRQCPTQLYLPSARHRRHTTDAV